MHQGHGNVCASASLCYAFCIVVTTLMEPLVLAHADGDTHIAVKNIGANCNVPRR